MEQKQERRRGHYQRSRRGPDRQGRSQRSSAQPQAKPGRDSVDVEQIMRDIRTRIAQRQGVDLSTQQIQDLAARRLESILDPRAVKPSLLDALRRSARDAPPRHAPDAFDELTFAFEDSTIYDSHRGALRFIRRLLNPILKLLFNPNPVIAALHRQARINTLRAERDADRDREQTEWNALHYEIVQRLVTEVSRVSLELKSITTRIESLDAKLEFNERRVRSIEGATHRSRPQPRSIGSAPAGATVARETPPVQTTPVQTAPVQATPVQTTADEAAGGVEGLPTEPAKRRRRRRRGRRQDSPQGPQGVVARAGEATPVGSPATDARTTGAPEETSERPPHPPIVAIAVDPSTVAADAPDPASPALVIPQPPVEAPAGEPETFPVPSTSAGEPQPPPETSDRHSEAAPTSLDDEPDAGHTER